MTVLALEAYATRPIRCGGVLGPERERLSKVGSKDPGFPRYDGSSAVRRSSHGCGRRRHDQANAVCGRRAAVAVGT
jgi:hypothetical protein